MEGVKLALRLLECHAGHQQTAINGPLNATVPGVERVTLLGHPFLLTLPTSLGDPSVVPS